MSNPKVFEFAKEVGMTPLALMDKIREWQVPVKSHMAELDPDTLSLIKRKLSGDDKPAEEPKKKATTRRVVKKAEPKAKEVEPAAEAAPKTKGTVVRRKGALAANTPASEAKEDGTEDESYESESDVESSTQEVAEAAAATETVEAVEPEPVAAPAAVAAAPAAPVEPVAPVEAPAPTPAPVEEKPESRVAAPARKKEVVVGTSGISSNTTPAQPRRNIVGRMDLSRVQPPPRTGGPGGGHGGAPRPGGGFGAANRPATGRGLRAGFVAASVPDIPVPDAGGDDRRKGGAFDKRRRTDGPPGAGGPAAANAREKEEPVTTFNAVEFRKRELVFQPKKKKTMLGREAMRTQITQPKASKRVLKVNNTMKVGDAAMEMGLKASQIIRALMSNGVMANVNTELDFDTLALIVPDFGWEAQNVHETAEDVLLETAFGDLAAEPVSRPPVVTIMGHVDHGKTSLLDTIRKARVAQGEAGGITQHIGAYSVTLDDGSKITFLDTPGHEAFTAMRARGANATDIAVIVVAADDGMMPQTQEAVNHAKAAGVPIIVAINKMDKPGANPDRIMQQLTELELVPEQWGGTTIYVPVSAMKGTGIDELLEQIRLVAEMAELKANPLRSGTGLVIEAKMEKGKGPVATLLVKDGTVKVGQNVVVGTSRGRVRSLMNDRGERVDEVGPGFPAEILGLDEVPAAGDRFDVVKDEETSVRVAQIRKDKELAAAQVTKKLSLEEIFSKVTQGDVKELNIILKADVHGSVEAIIGMLAKASAVEVKTRVLHSAVGGINESDVLLAHTSKGIIIGFNVRPDSAAQSKAKQMGVDIRSYTIVYELIDDVRKAMTGMLQPDVVEKVVGRAEVRNTFSVPKIGLIAGCFVSDGKIQRSNQVRLIRDGKIVYEGKLGSLKRFKDDAKEVATGFECGIGIENFNDVKVGDVIEAYVKEEIARELTAGPPA